MSIRNTAVLNIVRARHLTLQRLYRPRGLAKCVARALIFVFLGLFIASLPPKNGDGKVNLSLYTAQPVAMPATSNATKRPSGNTERHSGRKFLFYSILDTFRILLPCTSKIKRNWTDNHADYGEIRPGGWWQPVGCKPRYNVALIIPFRDREEHLGVLLNRLHAILASQMIAYRIFVVEQNGTDLFNKGALMNIGAWYVREHLGGYVFDCLIFHDVDMLPEDARNFYACPTGDMAVKHMSPAVDTLNYTLPYPELVGGVLAVSPDIFAKINGYSNLYWGWGAEDDDLWTRLQAEKIHVLRPPVSEGRYVMLKHDGRPGAKNRWALLRNTAKRYKNDGLNTMVQGSNFRIISTENRPTYTHLLVNLTISASAEYDREALVLIGFRLACGLTFVALIFALMLSNM